MGVGNPWPWRISEVQLVLAGPQVGLAGHCKDCSRVIFPIRQEGMVGREGQVMGVEAEGVLTNSDLALVAGGPASLSAGLPSETHYRCFVNSTSFGHMKA